MVELFNKLGVLIIGILGTLLAWSMNNGDMLFKFGRWIPIILASAYTVWRWRKDIKNEK